MWQAISVARKMTDALIWVFQNPRLAIEAVLVAALLLGGWLYNMKKAELAKSQENLGQMQDGLKQELRIRDGQIEILKREKGKVTTKIIYVPVEGGVVIKVPDTPNAEPIIIIKDKGFTFRPGFGIEWANNGLSPRLDAKLAYWSRWSFVFGGSRNGIGPGLSRHIDDIAFGRFRNTEIFAGYSFFGVRRTGGIPVVGFRSNF